MDRWPAHTEHPGENTWTKVQTCAQTLIPSANYNDSDTLNPTDNLTSRPKSTIMETTNENMKAPSLNKYWGKMTMAKPW